MMDPVLLTERHDVRAYWGSGGIALHILHLGKNKTK
jgi:hypothetical protein